MVEQVISQQTADHEETAARRSALDEAIRQLQQQQDQAGGNGGTGGTGAGAGAGAQVAGPAAAAVVVRQAAVSDDQALMPAPAAPNTPRRGTV